ncbi:MAG: hypothetical protein EOM87_07435 [Clostridia bacterium]|nr:hypothetical protein [Clostridia bacterium]
MFSELYFKDAIIGKKAATPYKMYNVVIDIRNISNLLPFKIIYYTYYELEERTVLYDYETEKDSLIAECENRIEQNIVIGKSIVRKWNISKNIDKIYIISIYYELEGRVDAYIQKEN